MSLDLCLKQLHVVHINVFHGIQYIRLVLFYSATFQSCKFQSPVSTRCVKVECHLCQSRCLIVHSLATTHNSSPLD